MSDYNTRFYLKDIDFDCYDGCFDLNSLDDKTKKNLDKSIFNFDTNEDKKLDKQEIISLFKAIGKEDNIIDEEEFENYCKTKKIKGKLLSNLLTQVIDSLPKTKVSSQSSTDTKTLNKHNLSSIKHKNYTQYSCSFELCTDIEYDTNLSTHSTSKRALKHEKYEYESKYYEKEDRLVGKKESIEITGIKGFIDKYFTNGYLDKKKLEADKENVEYPQLTIKNKEGNPVGEIKIKIKDLVFDRNINGLMMNLTQTLNCVENLSDEALDDLIYNISAIQIKEAKPKEIRPGDYNSDPDGLAHVTGKIKEEITLDYKTGFNEIVLTHEIGHSVDGKPDCDPNDVKDFYETKALEKEIKDFIQLLNEQRFFGMSYKRPYALNNEKELYAEWYTYQNLGEKGIKNYWFEGNTSYTMFKKLNSDKCPQEIKEAWSKIEEQFKNIKSDSRKATEFYKSSDTRFEQDTTTIQNKINQEDIDLVSQNYSEIEAFLIEKKLWGRLENLLKKYPKLAEELTYKTKEEKAEIILRIINQDSTIKKIFNSKINDIKTKQKNVKSKGLQEGLSYIKKNCQAMGKINLNNYDQNKLSKDTGLLEAIKTDLFDPYSFIEIPDSVKNKYEQATSVDIKDLEYLKFLPETWVYLVENYIEK